MKPRKLITSRVLKALYMKTEQGIPLKRAMRQLNIPLTQPTVKKLLTHYSINSDITRASIFPPWLSEDGPPVQEQPQDWVYQGYFPLGVWVCKT